MKGHAMTAQQSQLDTASVAGRLFRAPHPARLVLPILGLSALLGLITDGLSDRALYSTIALYAAPSLLSAVISLPLANALGGLLYLRRATLLSFLATIALLPSVIIWRLAFDHLSPVPFIVLGYASTIWLRQLVLMATSHADLFRSLPAVMTQPVLGFAAIYALYPTTVADLYAAVSLSLTFMVATSALVALANGPMKRAFGMNGLRLLRLFLDHITEGERSGRDEIEAFFRSFAVRVNALVGAAAFRTGGRTKVILTVPLVHPGPFGYLGGSDLPAKVSRDLRDISENVMVAHGPSNHDYNPAATGECARVAARVRQLVTSGEGNAEASPMVRAEHGNAKASAQILGGWALLTSTFSPHPSDDLDFAIGHAAVQMARLSGVRDGILVDSHNCLELGSGRVNFGSQESQDVLEACRKALERAKAQVGSGVRVGYHGRSGYEIHRDGLGAMGIQALVVEAAGKRAAYVLYDGNNMLPGLREEILSSLEALVDEAEVLTTDNHSVNMTMGGYNPVGAKIPRSRLLEETKEVVRAAVADLEPVTVAAATGEVEDLLIFGHENASRLSSVINSTVSNLRMGAMMSIALGVALSVALLLILY
jgi:putative membrane protein